MRALPYIIALACVFLMSSNVLGQQTFKPQTRERMWRIIICEDNDNAPCLRGKRRTLKECIDTIERIWKEERLLLACIAESKDGEPVETKSNISPPR